MRVFLDTNVLISALTTRGLCWELLSRVSVEHTLVVAEPVLEELERVLTVKFRITPERVHKASRGFRELADEVIAVMTSPIIASPDPNDAPILACALGGKADVFVTGDKALLDLGEVMGTPILSPRRFWQKLAGRD